MQTHQNIVFCYILNPGSIYYTAVNFYDVMLVDVIIHISERKHKYDRKSWNLFGGSVCHLFSTKQKSKHFASFVRKSLSQSTCDKVGKTLQ